MSSCDCTKSSFNPNLMLNPPLITFSQTMINATIGDSPTFIDINFSALPDTVSLVCGKGNGFDECGNNRLIKFTDFATM